MSEVAREVAGALRRSAKYGTLCEDTLLRMSDWAAGRHSTLKAATKAAKRKLHQVYGAYWAPADAGRIEELLSSLPARPKPEELRAVCREILAGHTSTAERLPVMDGLYEELFAATGTPSVVVDLACGLHPFALPWMPLAEDAEYFAFDIDHRLVDLVNDFLERLGHPPTATCLDLLVSVPEAPADVAFLLKSLPCLERQSAGASLRLLRQLRARRAVVSFPSKTLGGRDKGMADNYRNFVSTLSGELGAAVTVIEHPSEVFYVLDLSDLHQPDDERDL
jgi:16S rRNA (guanine(1405)-N(7))-methyltransferase